MATVFGRIHGESPYSSAGLTRVVIDKNDIEDKSNPVHRLYCVAYHAAIFMNNDPLKIRVCPATCKYHRLRDNPGRVCKSSEMSPGYVIVTDPVGKLGVIQGASRMVYMGCYMLHQFT